MPWLYRGSGSVLPPPTGSTLTFGWDFQQNAPDSGGVDATSASNAKGVMAALTVAAPVVMDMSLMNFGLPNPQPTQGGPYAWDTPGGAHEARAAMITAAGGTPVITLINVPGWMQLGQPAVPTLAPSATGGTIPAGTYCARISTVVGTTESYACAESASVTLTGTTSKVTLTWGAPTTVTPNSYNVYFGLAGAEKQVKVGVSPGGASTSYTVTSLTPVAPATNQLVSSTLGSGSDIPPDPLHYDDFASLCAAFATHFDGVNNPTKFVYYIVWNEMKGFFNHVTNIWDKELYTQMYNKVYTAIKSVRPDAIVGGPYVAMASQSVTTGHDAPLGLLVKDATGASLGTMSPKANNGPPTSAPYYGPGDARNGQWGYIDQRRMDVVHYWLGNMVGADFICVDGSSTIQNSGPGSQVIGDPQIIDIVTSSLKYADIGRWLAAEANAILPTRLGYSSYGGYGMNSLPIWWIESKISAGAYITNIAVGASPTLVTCPGHGLSAGTTSGVYISGVAQTIGINGGPYTVTYVDANTISVPVATSGSYATLLSNGQAYTTGFVTASPQWTSAQQVAGRIATLIMMAAGGISVGMYWEPEQIPKQSDMGVWWSSVIPTPPPSYLSAGGTITPLGTALLSVLPKLQHTVALVLGQPQGVVVATTSAGTILVNTTNATAICADSTSLAAGQVLVR